MILGSFGQQIAMVLASFFLIKAILTIENRYMYSRFGWFWEPMQCMGTLMDPADMRTKDVFLLLYRILRYCYAVLLFSSPTEPKARLGC